MKILIMITDSFPFGTGETFVANEMGERSGFDKVFIFPLIARDDDELCRDTGNSEVVPGNGRMKFSHVECLGNLKWRSVYEAFFALWHKHPLGCISSVLYQDSVVVSVRSSMMRIIESVKKLSPDKVVIYSYWFYTHALVAVEMKKMIENFCQNVSCVSRAHGFDVYDERSEIGYIPYRRYLLKRLKSLHVCSRQGTEYLRQHHPQYAHKIQTSYLGVLDQWNGLYPHQDNVFRIVSCAGLVPVKRIHLLIQALAVIKNRNIEWIHIGDGALMDSLQVLAQTTLPDNIAWKFSGRMDNKEICPFYMAINCHLLVNTSSSEGLPVTIMEAFSCGIPALAPHVGGIPEIVEDHVSGRLFPEDAPPEQIAQILLEIIDLRDQDYRMMCVKAREKYVSAFNAKTNYHKFYGNLLRD